MRGNHKIFWMNGTKRNLGKGLLEEDAMHKDLWRQKIANM